MKTTVDHIGTNKVRLAVEVSAPEVDKMLTKAYRKLAGQVRVPGFRPGKVPRPVIDQRLGRDFVRQEALRDSLPDLVAEAVRLEELDIVAPPEVDVTTFEDGKDLQFEAVVETRPTPDVHDYRGLEVRRPFSEVTDDDVDEQLERLRMRFASLEPIERPLQSGDFALIDLRTYRHEETVEEATASDLLVEVGAEMIVPELDAELEGKRKGDILKITTQLPERFGDKGGWQVGMQVLVKEGKARKLPDLDDDLAKTVSEFDSLEELRADLRQRLEEMKRNQADAEMRERLLDAFVERSVDVDLPDGMVEMEVDRLVVNMQRLLAGQQATIEQYMQAENIDYDALRQRFRSQAERNLTLRMGLEAVAAAESIEIGDEDRDAEIERIAQASGRPVEEIAEVLQDADNWESVQGDIIRSKALDLLVETADITDETAETTDQTA